MKENAQDNLYEEPEYSRTKPDLLNISNQRKDDIITSQGKYVYFWYGLIDSWCPMFKPYCT